jgi:hypothetical protein
MNTDTNGGGAAFMRPIGRSRSRAHSYRIYYLLALALVVLAAWGVARVSVCWGGYGWKGTILCHSQWITTAALVLGGYLFGVLVFDLSRDHMDTFAGKRMRRFRAALSGHRALEKSDARHVTASSILLIVFIVAFLAMVFFSPIRF